MSTLDPEALARLRTEAENRFHSVEIQAEDLRALLDAYDTARAEGVADERACGGVAAVESSRVEAVDGQQHQGRSNA